MQQQGIDLLDVGAQAIRSEAVGLETLASRLSNSFVDAVTCILHARGRVVVAGMGKSGHIGKKSLPPSHRLERHRYSCILPKLAMAIWG
jgi:hypothetical protein